ncbi:hypothetical protein EK904_004483 [Melospiza melodia maxima]|nr:hypothetical protein EK904_004483 [Melospiza melodia maxima]
MDMMCSTSVTREKVLGRRQTKGQTKLKKGTKEGMFKKGTKEGMFEKGTERQGQARRARGAVGAAEHPSVSGHRPLAARDAGAAPLLRDPCGALGHTSTAGEGWDGTQNQRIGGNGVMVKKRL